MSADMDSHENNRAALEELYCDWSDAEARDALTWPAAFRCPTPCSTCCERSAALPVTPIEAVVVADAVAKLEPALRARARERIAELASRIGTGTAEGGDPVAIDPGPGNLLGPCPLLENGRCSVYSARPLVCRAYGFSADADAAYFGCEILEPVLRSCGEIRLPSLEAARFRMPVARVLDRSGRALPVAGMLAEFLDRLLPPIARACLPEDDEVPSPHA